jgi:hypothetical protein
VQWDLDTLKTGAEVAAALKAAGFSGGKKTQIIVGSCFGGTDPADAKGNRMFGKSFAQQLANETRSRVRAGVVYDHFWSQAVHNTSVDMLLASRTILAQEVGRPISWHESAWQAGSWVHPSTITPDLVGSTELYLQCAWGVPGHVSSYLAFGSDEEEVVRGSWQNFSPR